MEIGKTANCFSSTREMLLLIQPSLMKLLYFLNRFGSGLIIYWFGYLDAVGKCPENADYIFVEDNFPKKEDLTLINYPYSL